MPVRRAVVSVSVGHGFPAMFVEAFEDLGWRASCAIFHERGSRTGWRKYPSRLRSMATGADATFVRERAATQAEIFRLVAAEQPDLLLVVRGEWMDAAAVARVRALRPGIRIVIWMYDPVKQYATGLDAKAVADAFYLYDDDDVATYRRETGGQAQRLDLGYSRRRFSPSDTIERQVDISMTGSFALSSYDRRMAVASTLARIAETHGLSLELAGPMWTPWDPFAASVRRRVQREWPAFFARFRNGPLTYPAQNQLFARSRINVNVHRDESTRSANTRVFEILGAGGFELCDANEIVMEHFRPGAHLDVYRNDEELEAKILYYLAHADERESIAAAGHACAREHHQLTDRVRQIVVGQGLEEATV